ncbi:MAG: hypothetical protein H0V71_01880, partial [Chloroflexi bacterium]|nr:hypothetical protein [Chloroflexota bacterium]
MKHSYRAVLVLALAVIFAFNNAAFINAVQPTLDLSGGTADPPGFNGFVKIHEGNTESEQLVDNEPHVCTFHVHGFKFDAPSSGYWNIQSWPPTGNRTVVKSGTWTADANGDWRSVLLSLPDGHYRLNWDQTDPAAPGGEKHKEFWVKCAPTPPAPPTPIAPSLTLNKIVSGGTAPKTAWNLTATRSGTLVLSGAGGASGNVTPGSYTLAETGTVTDYTNGSTYSCVKNGGSAVLNNTIVLVAGDTATCSITNTFTGATTASLTLNKIVSGGTAPKTAWNLTATRSGTLVLSGAGGASGNVTPGSYT